MSGGTGLALVGAAVLVAIGRWAYFIFGPMIDNVLGVLTRRDMRHFRTFLLNGRP